MASHPARAIIDDPVVRHLLDALPDAVVVTTAARFDPGWCPTVVYVNDAFTRITGYTAAEVIGGLPSRWAPEAANHEAHVRLCTSLERGESIRVRVHLRTKAGDERFLDTSVAPFGALDDGARYFIEVSRDVTTDTADEVRWQEAQAVGQIGSWEWLIADAVVRCSPELYSIFGIDPTAFEETDSGFLINYVHSDDQQLVQRLVDRTLKTGEPFECDYRIIVPGGSTGWVHTRARLIRDATGRPVRMLGTCQDLTARKALEDRLRQRMLLDSLTQLPNALVLSDRLAHALAVQPRSGGVVAVFHVDLDDFNAVNLAHGSAVGDQILIDVAKRLTARVRSGDTVARANSDEFVVICEHLTDDRAGRDVAHALVDAIATPFLVGTSEVRITACVGVAMANNDEADLLLRRADAALYGAKAMGHGRVLMHSGQ